MINKFLKTITTYALLAMMVIFSTSTILYATTTPHEMDQVGFSIEGLTLDADIADCLINNIELGGQYNGNHCFVESSLNITTPENLKYVNYMSGQKFIPYQWIGNTLKTGLSRLVLDNVRADLETFQREHGGDYRFSDEDVKAYTLKKKFESFYATGETNFIPDNETPTIGGYNDAWFNLSEVIYRGWSQQEISKELKNTGIAYLKNELDTRLTAPNTNITYDSAKDIYYETMIIDGIEIINEYRLSETKYLYYKWETSDGFVPVPLDKEKTLAYLDDPFVWDSAENKVFYYSLKTPMTKQEVQNSTQTSFEHVVYIVIPNAGVWKQLPTTFTGSDEEYIELKRRFSDDFTKKSRRYFNYIENTFTEVLMREGEIYSNNLENNPQRKEYYEATSKYLQKYDFYRVNPINLNYTISDEVTQNYYLDEADLAKYFDKVEYAKLNKPNVFEIYKYQHRPAGAEFEVSSQTKQFDSYTIYKFVKATGSEVQDKIAYKGALPDGLTEAQRQSFQNYVFDKHNDNQNQFMITGEIGGYWVPRVFPEYVYQGQDIVSVWNNHRGEVYVDGKTMNISDIPSCQNVPLEVGETDIYCKMSSSSDNYSKLKYLTRYSYPDGGNYIETFTYDSVLEKPPFSVGLLGNSEILTDTHKYYLSDVETRALHYRSNSKVVIRNNNAASTTPRFEYVKQTISLADSVTSGGKPNNLEDVNTNVIKNSSGAITHIQSGTNSVQAYSKFSEKEGKAYELFSHTNYGLGFTVATDDNILRVPTSAVGTVGNYRLTDVSIDNPYKFTVRKYNNVLSVPSTYNSTSLRDFIKGYTTENQLRTVLNGFLTKNDVSGSEEVFYLPKTTVDGWKLSGETVNDAINRLLKTSSGINKINKFYGYSKGIEAIINLGSSASSEKKIEAFLNAYQPSSSLKLVDGNTIKYGSLLLVGSVTFEKSAGGDTSLRYESHRSNIGTSGQWGIHFLDQEFKEYSGGQEYTPWSTSAWSSTGIMTKLKTAMRVGNNENKDIKITFTGVSDLKGVFGYVKGWSGVYKPIHENYIGTTGTTSNVITSASNALSENPYGRYYTSGGNALLKPNSTHGFARSSKDSRLDSWSGGLFGGTGYNYDLGTLYDGINGVELNGKRVASSNSLTGYNLTLSSIMGTTSTGYTQAKKNFINKILKNINPTGNSLNYMNSVRDSFADLGIKLTFTYYSQKVSNQYYWLKNTVSGSSELSMGSNDSTNFNESHLTNVYNTRLYKAVWIKDGSTYRALNTSSFVFKNQNIREIINFNKPTSGLASEVRAFKLEVSGAYKTGYYFKNVEEEYYVDLINLVSGNPYYVNHVDHSLNPTGTTGSFGYPSNPSAVYGGQWFEASKIQNDFNITFTGPLVQLTKHFYSYDQYDLKQTYTDTMLEKYSLNIRLLDEDDVMKGFYLEGTHGLSSSQSSEFRSKIRTYYGGSTVTTLSEGVLYRFVTPSSVRKGTTLASGVNEGFVYQVANVASDIQKHDIAVIESTERRVVDQTQPVFIKTNTTPTYGSAPKNEEPFSVSLMSGSSLDGVIEVDDSGTFPFNLFQHDNAIIRLNSRIPWNNTIHQEYVQPLSFDKYQRFKMVDFGKFYKDVSESNLNSSFNNKDSNFRFFAIDDARVSELGNTSLPYIVWDNEERKEETTFNAAFDYRNHVVLVNDNLVKTGYRRHLLEREGSVGYELVSDTPSSFYKYLNTYLTSNELNKVHAITPQGVQGIIINPDVANIVFEDGNISFSGNQTVIPTNVGTHFFVSNGVTSSENNVAIYNAYKVSTAGKTNTGRVIDYEKVYDLTKLMSSGNIVYANQKEEGYTTETDSLISARNEYQSVKNLFDQNAWYLGIGVTSRLNKELFNNGNYRFKNNGTNAETLSSTYVINLDSHTNYEFKFNAVSSLNNVTPVIKNHLGQNVTFTTEKQGDLFTLKFNSGANNTSIKLNITLAGGEMLNVTNKMGLYKSSFDGFNSSSIHDFVYIPYLYEYGNATTYAKNEVIRTEIFENLFRLINNKVEMVGIHHNSTTNNPSPIYDTNYSYGGGTKFVGNQQVGDEKPIITKKYTKYYYETTIKRTAVKNFFEEGQEVVQIVNFENRENSGLVKNYYSALTNAITNRIMKDAYQMNLSEEDKNILSNPYVYTYKLKDGEFTASLIESFASTLNAHELKNKTVQDIYSAMVVFDGTLNEFIWHYLGELKNSTLYTSNIYIMDGVIVNRDQVSYKIYERFVKETNEKLIDNLDEYQSNFNNLYSGELVTNKSTSSVFNKTELGNQETMFGFIPKIYNDYQIDIRINNQVINPFVSFMNIRGFDTALNSIGTQQTYEAFEVVQSGIGAKKALKLNMNIGDVLDITIKNTSGLLGYQTQVFRYEKTNQDLEQGFYNDYDLYLEFFGEQLNNFLVRKEYKNVLYKSGADLTNIQTIKGSHPIEVYDIDGKRIPLENINNAIKDGVIDRGMYLDEVRFEWVKLDELSNQIEKVEEYKHFYRFKMMQDQSEMAQNNVFPTLYLGDGSLYFRSDGNVVNFVRNGVIYNPLVAGNQTSLRNRLLPIHNNQLHDIGEYNILSGQATYSTHLMDELQTKEGVPLRRLSVDAIAKEIENGNVVYANPELGNGSIVYFPVIGEDINIQKLVEERQGSNALKFKKLINGETIEELNFKHAHMDPTNPNGPLSKMQKTPKIYGFNSMVDSILIKETIDENILSNPENFGYLALANLRPEFKDFIIDSGRVNPNFEFMPNKNMYDLYTQKGKTGVGSGWSLGYDHIAIPKGVKQVDIEYELDPLMYDTNIVRNITPLTQPKTKTVVEYDYYTKFGVFNGETNSTFTYYDYLMDLQTIMEVILQTVSEMNFNQEMFITEVMYKVQQLYALTDDTLSEEDKAEIADNPYHILNNLNWVNAGKKEYYDAKEKIMVNKDVWMAIKSDGTLARVHEKDRLIKTESSVDEPQNYYDDYYFANPFGLEYLVKMNTEQKDWGKLIFSGSSSVNNVQGIAGLITLSKITDHSVEKLIKDEVWNDPLSLTYPQIDMEYISYVLGLQDTIELFGRPSRDEIMNNGVLDSRYKVDLLDLANIFTTDSEYLSIRYENYYIKQGADKKERHATSLKEFFNYFGYVHDPSGTSYLSSEAMKVREWFNVKRKSGEPIKPVIQRLNSMPASTGGMLSKYLSNNGNLLTEQLRDLFTNDIMPTYISLDKKMADKSNKLERILSSNDKWPIKGQTFWDKLGAFLYNNNVLGLTQLLTDTFYSPFAQVDFYTDFSVTNFKGLQTNLVLEPLWKLYLISEFEQFYSEPEFHNLYNFMEGVLFSANKLGAVKEPENIGEINSQTSEYTDAIKNLTSDKMVAVKIGEKFVIYKKDLTPKYVSIGNQKDVFDREDTHYITNDNPNDVTQFKEAISDFNTNKIIQRPRVDTEVIDYAYDYVYNLTTNKKRNPYEHLSGVYYLRQGPLFDGYLDGYPRYVEQWKQIDFAGRLDVVESNLLEKEGEVFKNSIGVWNLYTLYRDNEILVSGDNNDLSYGPISPFSTVLFFNAINNLNYDFYKTASDKKLEYNTSDSKDLNYNLDYEDIFGNDFMLEYLNSSNAWEWVGPIGLARWYSNNTVTKPIVFETKDGQSVDLFDIMTKVQSDYKVGDPGWGARNYLKDSQSKRYKKQYAVQQYIMSQLWQHFYDIDVFGSVGQMRYYDPKFLEKFLEDDPDRTIDDFLFGGHDTYRYDYNTIISGKEWSSVNHYSHLQYEPERITSGHGFNEVFMKKKKANSENLTLKLKEIGGFTNLEAFVNDLGINQVEVQNFDKLKIKVSNLLIDKKPLMYKNSSSLLEVLNDDLSFMKKASYDPTNETINTTSYNGWKALDISSGEIHDAYLKPSVILRGIPTQTTKLNNETTSTEGASVKTTIYNNLSEFGFPNTENLVDKNGLKGSYNGFVVLTEGDVRHSVGADFGDKLLLYNAYTKEKPSNEEMASHLERSVNNEKRYYVKLNNPIANSGNVPWNLLSGIMKIDDLSPNKNYVIEVVAFDDVGIKSNDGKPVVTDLGVSAKAIIKFRSGLDLVNNPYGSKFTENRGNPSSPYYLGSGALPSWAQPMISLEDQQLFTEDNSSIPERFRLKTINNEDNRLFVGMSIRLRSIENDSIHGVEGLEFQYKKGNIVYSVSTEENNLVFVKSNATPNDVNNGIIDIDTYQFLNGWTEHYDIKGETSTISVVNKMFNYLKGNIKITGDNLDYLVDGTKVQVSYQEVRSQKVEVAYFDYNQNGIYNGVSLQNGNNMFTFSETDNFYDLDGKRINNETLMISVSEGNVVSEGDYVNLVQNRMIMSRIRNGFREVYLVYYTGANYGIILD